MEHKELLKALQDGGRLELLGITKGPLSGGVKWRFCTSYYDTEAEGMYRSRIHHGTHRNIEGALQDAATSFDRYGLV